MTMLLGLTAPDGAGGAGAGRNVATCFLLSELPSAGESHPTGCAPPRVLLTKCFINPGFGVGGRPWPPRARGHTCPPTCSLPPAPAPLLSLELGLLRQGWPPCPQAWSCPVPSEASCHGAGALACPRPLPARVVIARPSQWETTARGWSLGLG